MWESEALRKMLIPLKVPFHLLTDIQNYAAGTSFVWYKTFSSWPKDKDPWAIQLHLIHLTKHQYSTHTALTSERLILCFRVKELIKSLLRVSSQKKRKGKMHRHWRGKNCLVGGQRDRCFLQWTQRLSCPAQGYWHWTRLSDKTRRIGFRISGINDCCLEWG